MTHLPNLHPQNWQESMTLARAVQETPPAPPAPPPPAPADPSIPYPPITPLLSLRARRLLHHLAELTATEPDALAGFILERALQTECMILEEITQTPTDEPGTAGLPDGYRFGAASLELELGNEAIMEKLTHDGTLTP
jgi:hypothetical protein